jgi:hypothetical protein
MIHLNLHFVPELNVEETIREQLVSSGLDLDRPDNAELASKMSEFLMKSRSINTSKKYFSSFKRWCNFISSRGKQSIPANSLHIALYITHLLNSGCSYHVIASAIYSIKWAH